MSSRKKVVVLVATLILTAATAMAANNAEEIIFTTPGSLMALTGNQHVTGGTPFGFWIWCAAQPSPASAPPTYQAAFVCQGSMYFYFLGTPEHVSSDAFSKPPSVTENGEGLYTINVSAKDFSCTLTNITVNSGPHDTVIVNCTFDSQLGGGSGMATVTNATVNSTGPH